MKLKDQLNYRDLKHLKYERAQMRMNLYLGTLVYRNFVQWSSIEIIVFSINNQNVLFRFEDICCTNETIKNLGFGILTTVAPTGNFSLKSVFSQNES